MKINLHAIFWLAYAILLLSIPASYLLDASKEEPEISYSSASPELIVDDGFPLDMLSNIVITGNGYPYLMTIDVINDSIIIHTDSGNVSISLTDGAVTYPESVNVDSAASAFWEAIGIISY